MLGVFGCARQEPPQVSHPCPEITLVLLANSASGMFLFAASVNRMVATHEVGLHLLPCATGVNTPAASVDVAASPGPFKPALYFLSNILFQAINARHLFS